MLNKQEPAKTRSAENVSVSLRMETSIFKLKRFVDNMVNLYTQSIRIKPHEVSDVVSQKATALMQKGRYGKAIDEYNRLIGMGKEEAHIYYNLGICCEYEGLNEEAERAYKKAIEIDKGFDAAFSRLGLLAIKNDDPKTTIEYLNPLIRKNGVSFEILYHLGVAYDKLKDYDNAVMNFKKAIAVEPKYSNAYKRLGYTYDAMGAHQQAVECFKKAMELEEI
jgi:tetratricopeptide (TPR) repeat protein